MATVREAWTDERLDDLKDGMHHEFGLVRSEMDRRFDEVHKEFDRVHADIRDLRSETNTRFDAVDRRFDSLQRTILVGNFSIVAAIIGAVLARGLF